MVYYPFVGMVIGLGLWGVYLILSLALPHAISSVLLLGCLGLMTGGLHIDGLADTVDGLCGGYSREERLRIFKDPHVGPMAVASVVLVLLAQYTSLNAVPPYAMLPALVLMATLSRYSMVQLAYFSPYARATGGLGEPFVRGIQQKHLYTALLLTFAVTLLCGRGRGVLIGGVVSMATAGYQVYFRQRLGGITGDVLGATNEANAMLVLVLVAALYK